MYLSVTLLGAMYIHVKRYVRTPVYTRKEKQMARAQGSNMGSTSVIHTKSRIGDRNTGR